MSRTKLLGSIAATAILLLVTSVATYRQFVLRAEAASRLLEEGRTALAAGEFDKAIEWWGGALAKTFLNETKAQAYALRSKAEIESGRFDEAIADSTSALRMKPAFADAYLQRALAHQKKGETEKALSDFNEAARLAVANPQAYYERGRLLLDAGEAAKAAADFAEAIRRGANDVGVYILRARACQASNDPDAAIASLDLAMQKEPPNQEARALRGDLYYKKKDIAKAMDDFAELRTSKGESWATQGPRVPPHHSCRRLRI